MSVSVQIRLVVIASKSERSIDTAHNRKWEASSEKKRNLNGKLKEERDKMLMAHHTLETTAMDIFAKYSEALTVGFALISLLHPCICDELLSSID